MFADIIKKVPARNYGIDGLEVHVDHTSTGTVYFVSAEKEVVFPEHAHAAQWTIVVTGSCTFTANGKSKIYSAGETYFIPAGLRHQITLHAGYSEVDYVDDPLDGEDDMKSTPPKSAVTSSNALTALSIWVAKSSLRIKNVRRLSATPSNISSTICKFQRTGWLGLKKLFAPRRTT